MRATLQQARDAKRSPKAKQLAARPNVNGVGITKRDGSYALSVHLVQPAGQGELPHEIDGVPIHADVVGRAQPA